MKSYHPLYYLFPKIIHIGKNKNKKLIFYILLYLIKYKMNFQNWEPVGWNKTGEKNTNESKTVYLNNQLRKNNVISQNKNVSNKTQIDGVSNIRKIENEEETFKHKTITLSVAKKIAQARCEKKLTQKDLANTLNLPFKIIQDYEAGKAIPNPVVLNKIEKILGRIRD